MNFYKTLLTGLVFSLLLFTSCQEKEKKEVTDTNESVEMTLDQKKQQLQNVAPSSSGSATTLPPGSVNPPHGEPGHRCDIPVGAPLDGSQPQKQMKVTPAENKIEMPPANPGNTGPKPEKNPEHGQPWHRCDIKVGDPLP